MATSPVGSSTCSSPDPVSPPPPFALPVPSAPGAGSAGGRRRRAACPRDRFRPSVGWGSRRLVGNGSASSTASSSATRLRSEANVAGASRARSTAARSDGVSA
eukprot:2186600-Pleurochrysis_carterae.AAC.1